MTLMDVNRCYLAKKDLQTYSPVDITRLARLYGLDEYSGNDLLWILALKIHSKHSRAQMPAVETMKQLTIGLEVEMCILDCDNIADKYLQGQFTYPKEYYKEIAAKLNTVGSYNFVAYDTADKEFNRKYTDWLITPDTTVECTDGKGVLRPNGRIGEDYYDSQECLRPSDCIKRQDSLEKYTYTSLELISPILKLSDEPQVKDVLNLIKNTFIVNITSGMGTHIHISHPDLHDKSTGLQLLGRICGWWLMYEPIMLFLTTRTRLNSTVLTGTGSNTGISGKGKHSTLWANSMRSLVGDNLKKVCKELINGGDNVNRLVLQLASSKHTALNIRNLLTTWGEPVGEVGTPKPTIEFRLFHTTMDTKTVQRWMNVIGYFVADSMQNGFISDTNLEYLCNGSEIVYNTLKDTMYRISAEGNISEPVNQTIPMKSKIYLKYISNGLFSNDNTGLQQDYLKVAQEYHPAWFPLPV